MRVLMKSKMPVRIKSISIRNFKNVLSGDLSFENSRKKYNASIVGLYGQNGSGKTALIDAIAMLKFILCGYQIPTKYSDLINVDAESASIRCSFKIGDDEDDDTYEAEYGLFFTKTTEETTVNTDGTLNPGDIKTEIVRETFSLSGERDGKRMPKQLLIDTENTAVFGPKSKYDAIVGKDRDIYTDLIVAKKLSRSTSSSFIFCQELQNVIEKNCGLDGVSEVFASLRWFGLRKLFVIDSEIAGRISLNALPLIIGDEKHGSVFVSLNDGAVVPESSISIVNKVIDNMNIVLPEIVPGLKIGIRELGSQMMRDGSAGVRIGLVSYKAGKEISLQYESEGIKKIIAILQLLIAVYNDNSITVAIDELDAGVFEYLLGEILRIISEKGKGQLVFTSHNLRPLETIDTGFVAFTTTNPSDRYMRIKTSGRTKNLRDYYYRDIVLGENEGRVYVPTRNSEIALAFREAGELYGS